MCTPPTADTETDCVCALTQGSFVLSEIPSTSNVSFVGKTHSAYCCGRSAPGCLCGASSVGKQAGQPGEINADSVLKRGQSFCNSWKKCFELWRNPLVTVSAPALGNSVLHFAVMHSQDVFSRSASNYSALSDFLGLQLNMQSYCSFYWFQIWLFNSWKGNMSAPKSSPEKVILQGTEFHSHSEYLIWFPYISSKSSLKLEYLITCLLLYLRDLLQMLLHLNTWIYV